MLVDHRKRVYEPQRSNIYVFALMVCSLSRYLPSIKTMSFNKGVVQVRSCSLGE